MPRLLRVVLAGLLVLGADGCDGSPAAPPATPAAPVLPTAPLPPAALQIVDGDGQEAIIYSAVPRPLRVRVTGRKGNPMAGVRVDWDANAGIVSPASTLTDSSGVAAVTWRFGDGSSTFRVGTYQARATVAGLPPATFIGHARRGVDLVSVSLSPAQVNVASGAASVSVTLHVRDDIGGITEAAFRFRSPSGQRAPYTHFSLASGTVEDGVWQGTVQIPQGGEAGVWTLEIVLGNSRVREYWNTLALQQSGFPVALTVTAGP